jgi:hypothetical protein
MSGLTSLLTGGVIESVGQIVDDLHTSDEERAAAENEAQKIENQLLLGQQDINKTEAQHASLFVAGWRPWIGWIAGTALGLIYIPQALVKAAMWGWQVYVLIDAWKPPAAMPTLPAYPDMGVADLITLLLALLGMSTLRHRETMAGKARSTPLGATPPNHGQQEAP